MPVRFHAVIVQLSQNCNYNDATKELCYTKKEKKEDGEKGRKEQEKQGAGLGRVYCGMS